MDRSTAEKMIALRAEGKSIRSIAKELKLSKTTVCEKLQALSDEVENAVTLAKDRLLEQLKMDKVAVFESKLKLFQKLYEHIEQRDFSDVPTDRLVKAWLSLGLELRLENVGSPRYPSFAIDLLPD